MQALLGHPRENVDPVALAQALEWQHGLRVKFGWDVLDTNDQPTGEVLPALTGSMVKWAYRVPEEISAGGAGAESAIRRTASLPLAGPTSINVLARRFRPWASVLTRAGDEAKFYRGVFVSTLPPIRDDGIVVTRELDLVGKEHRYSLDELRQPRFVARDTDVLLLVRGELTARYGETAFDFPAGQFRLPEGLAFDAEENRLIFYNTLLGAVGLGALHCNDFGLPRVRLVDEVNTKPADITYEPGTTTLPGGDVEAVTPELPNVIEFLAQQGPTLPTEGNGKFTVRNQSTGPASIDQRGFEVFMRVTLDVPVNQSTGNGQPALVAKGRQQAQRLFAGGGFRTKGQVGFNPRFSDDDVIVYRKPRLELNSNAEWLLTEWSDTFDADSGITEIAAELRVDIT